MNTHTPATPTTDATEAILSHTERVQVRFSDVDAMRCVWHGSYVRYFEDGREAFGRHYTGLGYADIMASGIMAPVVDLQVQYHAQLRLNDVALITTRYDYRRGARIDFSYEVRRASDGLLCATGHTTQLFIDPDGTLMVSLPDYYRAWRERWQVGR
jgi:acyl-CoA thioester hydrolase